MKILGLHYFLKKSITSILIIPIFERFRFDFDLGLIDRKARCEGSPRRDSSKGIRPQYLIVALVIIGEGEVGGRHLVLLRPPAAHSAIGKISISEPPTPFRDRSYQIARLILLALSMSSGRFVVGWKLIAPIGNKGEVIEREVTTFREIFFFRTSEPIWQFTCANFERRLLLDSTSFTQEEKTINPKWSHHIRTYPSSLIYSLVYSNESKYYGSRLKFNKHSIWSRTVLFPDITHYSQSEWPTLIRCMTKIKYQNTNVLKCRSMS